MKPYFNELMKKQYIIFDGAMGTMLQKAGMKPGETPEMLNFTNPEMIEKVVSAYIDAGADIVCPCTFGANRYKLAGKGVTVKETVLRSVEIAKKARGSKEVLVGIDVGPIGKMLEPTGNMTFDEAYDIYKEVVTAGEEAGADLISFQTMTELAELRAAILAAKENTSLPIIASVTVEKNGRTFTGCSLASIVHTAQKLGVDAIGINCSLGPDEMKGSVMELLENANVPVIVMPNAGLPNPDTQEYTLDADSFARAMLDFYKLGVKILGGCCGTTPEFIGKMKKLISECPQPKTVMPKPEALVCSGIKCVKINTPVIIGERINPTGKKRFQQALKEHDIDYILNQAVEQVEAGAEILDVNVGIPDIDEKALMTEAVKALAGVVDVPLQIDSTNPDVIESALRIYCGRAVVNSVNGDDESLNSILPIVKQYGACVVGLTLDKNGIPQSVEERVKIARKIVSRANDFGIPTEDVFIDCLTLTASAEQEAVMETLDALELVKKELGVKTVLGVSNVSFGLPERELVNSTFLTMALARGLDLPIMNPNIRTMTGSLRAFRLLRGDDRKSKDFVAAYANQHSSDKSVNAASSASDSSKMTLSSAIANGLKQTATEIIEEMLKTEEPMTIIEAYMIPLLDRVGADFESGKIYLPQLITAAETSGVCFDVIKRKMQAGGVSSVSAGRVVLATVQGDVHDIGKNIVKVLMENYGFDVIDLGRDVDPQLIVETVKNEKIRLVGLSALMTTTLPAMEKTIKMLRASGADCKVIVGGAVLTEEYAEKIGADFYAKDAKVSVDIAKTVFSDNR